MKKTVLMLPFFLFFFAGISNALNCDEGRALLEKVFMDSPNEMTAPYIHVALSGCPDSADLFLRIAQYYDGWFRDALDPGKRSEFRGLARDYYQKAIGATNEAGADKIKILLAQLEKSQEFNETAFRALRPTSQGQTGSGLRLDVYFDSDSYKLSKTAQKHLDVLGKVLASEPSIRISLEGHTDMKGTADYNKTLSLKRAKSAREYLERKFGVDEDRILVSGFGFERLADRKAPYSAVNRRVEVIKLSF